MYLKFQYFNKVNPNIFYQKIYANISKIFANIVMLENDFDFSRKTQHWMEHMVLCKLTDDDYKILGGQ